MSNDKQNFKLVPAFSLKRVASFYKPLCSPHQAKSKRQGTTVISIISIIHYQKNFMGSNVSGVLCFLALPVKCCVNSV